MDDFGPTRIASNCLDLYRPHAFVPIAELIGRLEHVLQELWLSEFGWESLEVFVPIYDTLCGLMALHGFQLGESESRNHGRKCAGPTTIGMPGVNSGFTNSYLFAYTYLVGSVTKQANIYNYQVAKGVAHYVRMMRLQGFERTHSLSPQQLAAKLPCSPRTVQHWEKGDRVPAPYLERALRDLARELAQSAIAT
jgi:DNA-binding transcriptional regulator YiaG